MSEWRWNKVDSHIDDKYVMLVLLFLVTQAFVSITKEMRMKMPIKEAAHEAAALLYTQGNASGIFSQHCQVLSAVGG